MARVAVADEVIIEAGKEIEAEGRVVNGFGLRRKIGSGEQRRLYEVWAQYKTQHDPEPELSRSTIHELPTNVLLKLDKINLELSGQLKALVINIYDLAKQDIQGQLKHAIEIQEEKQDLLQQALDDADSALNEVAAEADALRTQLESMERDLQQARALVQEKSIESAQEKERAIQFSLQAKAEAERLSAELSKWQQRHELAQEENKQLQITIQELNGNNKQLEVERSLQQREIEALKDELKASKKDIEQLHKAELVVTKELAKAQESAQLHQQFYEKEHQRTVELQAHLNHLQMREPESESVDDKRKE